MPTKEWQGKSGLGDYGDFVMETDWAVGEVLAALDKAGIADNTLVIFTSDNGCSPAAGIPDLERQGHYPSELRRGYKADIWDGGHRIPFIARWPGKIKPGTEMRPAHLPDRPDGDLCRDPRREAAGQRRRGQRQHPAGAAGHGRPSRCTRRSCIIPSTARSRSGRANWKLELCAGSGGWSAPKPGSKEAKRLPPVQLYDMTKDVGERTNEYKAHPEIVARLTKLLEKYVADGRSTPGHAAEERRRHQALEGRAARRRNTSQGRGLSWIDCGGRHWRKGTGGVPGAVAEHDWRPIAWQMKPGNRNESARLLENDARPC